MCCGVIIGIQTVLASTLRRTSDIDEYMIRDQKTRRRQNYIEESALEKDLFENINDILPLKQFDPDETEEQPSLTVDYANMIRNDIILLDNSVETRTRKRGNIKVEKNNQALPDFDCNCEIDNKPQDLGVNAFPRFIQNKTCSEQKCHPAYLCQPSIYYFKILKRKERKSQKQEPQLERQIPEELKHRFVIEEHPVITACICTRDYILY
ncbi:prothoracicotropic hormone [Amyelois transitella]|uniref:prothoracicotropic hormone n=1 Tax=Amyelois transitella TaxID=680683 RepID=UPI00067B20BC|nr:prothoracicotropic hormone [Amyelois transitella]